MAAPLVSLQAASGQSPKKRAVAVASARVGRKPLLLEMHGRDARGDHRVYVAYGRKRMWLTVKAKVDAIAQDAQADLAKGVTFRGDGAPVTVTKRGEKTIRFSGGLFGPRTDLDYTTQGGPALAIVVVVIVVASLAATGILKGAADGVMGALETIADVVSGGDRDEDDEDSEDSDDDGR